MSSLQVNLHSHSEGSTLDGYARVGQIVSRASELGQQAAVLTDHGDVNQHLALQRAAKAAGLHSIFGMEGYWTQNIAEAKTFKKFGAAPTSHICLLAKDQKGLANLWAWSSMAYGKEHHWYRPLADPELMRQYSGGLYASDGCAMTTFAKAIAEGREDKARQILGTLLDIFGDNFYMELHTWQFVDPKDDTIIEWFGEKLSTVQVNQKMADLNHAKVRFANQLGVPLVVVNDSHHAYPEDWENHELVWSMNTNKLDQFGTGGGQKADHHMGDDELYQWMAKHGIGRSVVEEAIANSHQIAMSCTAEITKTMDIPRLAATEHDDLVDLLSSCEASLQKKVLERGLDPQPYMDRLETELRIITDKHFAGYFNIVADYVRAYKSGTWANYVKNGTRTPMLVGPARGSAGGSIVAWLLGITTLDPVKYGTLFERFMTPERKSLPDIDVDVPRDLRQGAIDYLRGRYGHDHVCTIGTLIRSQPRAILANLCRVYDVPWDERRAMAEIIESIAEAADEEVDDITWDEVVERKGGELAAWARKHPRLFEQCGELVGTIQSYGTHPSGLLVSNTPVDTAIPTRTRAGMVTTQFDMVDIELLGGVKFDILGIRHLDSLMVARDLIHKRHGKWIDYESFGDDEMSDPAIWEQIDLGRTTGIFQIESALATETAVKHRPRSEREVAEVLAIIRPGVVDAGLLTHYLDRRAGIEPVTYDHPMMADIVGDTQGILVWQESILTTVQKLAWFTPDEADDLRKALGKKHADKIEAMREKFEEGCLANAEFMASVEDDRAGRKAVAKIWSSINAAGRYAFNYSHAVGYAILATWEIWTKYYYPEEFIVGLLATDPANTNRYIREARRRGINILPPCVNRSEVKFTISDDGIRYGIDSVRGVGAAQARDILAGRPYKSVADYATRAGKGTVKSTVLNLIKIGAFDSLGDRTEMLRSYQRVHAHRELAESTLQDPVKLDNRIATRLTENPTRWVFDVPDFSDPKVMLAIETELVGTHVTVDPLGPYLKMLDGVVINHPDELRKVPTGDGVRIGGLVTTIKLHTVQKGRTKGQNMAFITLDYNEELFEVVAFPEKWNQIKHMLVEGIAVACQCTRTARGVQLVHLELLDQLLQECS